MSSTQDVDFWGAINYSWYLLETHRIKGLALPFRALQAMIRKQLQKILTSLESFLLQH